MSRRSRLIQALTLFAAFTLAVDLSAHIVIWAAMAWCTVGGIVGILGGAFLGAVLDEFWPPRPGWWRQGYRRG